MTERTTGPSTRTLLTALFTLAVLWFGGRSLVGQWDAVQSLRAGLSTQWSLVLLASAIVGVSYVVLIQTWRLTVSAWGETLGFATAARIWFVSNLGRYLPGKVWQIGAMGVMAQEAGVSSVAAIGSALVVSLVHLIIGFAVVGLTGRDLFLSIVPPGTPLTPVLTLAVVLVLLAPRLLPMAAMGASKVLRRPFSLPQLPARAIWVAVAGSAIAWVLFGLAFHLLGIGLLRHPTGDASDAIAVFTLSYLAGFLALIAPGGIGVREGVMALLLTRAGIATAAEATWLVVASRLWLTVLEILPGALLLTRSVRRPSDSSRASA
jgi:uncharacterized membrane protein YbhN (UPF0104 family)